MPPKLDPNEVTISTFTTISPITQCYYLLSTLPAMCCIVLISLKPDRTRLTLSFPPSVLSRPTWNTNSLPPLLRW